MLNWKSSAVAVALLTVHPFAASPAVQSDNCLCPVFSEMHGGQAIPSCVSGCGITIHTIQQGVCSEPECSQARNCIADVTLEAHTNPGTTPCTSWQVNAFNPATGWVEVLNIAGSVSSWSTHETVNTRCNSGTAFAFIANGDQINTAGVFVVLCGSCPLEVPDEGGGGGGEGGDH